MNEKAARCGLQITDQQITPEAPGNHSGVVNIWCDPAYYPPASHHQREADTGGLFEGVDKFLAISSSGSKGGRQVAQNKEQQNPTASYM